MRAPLASFPDRRFHHPDLGPAATAALDHMGKPAMPIDHDDPTDPRYALLVPPSRKPLVLSSLDALARRIHRDRGQRAVECAGPIAVGWADGTRIMVSIHALDDAGARTDLLAYAWLGGGEHDSQKLRAALDRVQPQSLFGAEAA